MKILCAGDLHLGRSSSRLPSRHDEIASPTTTWKRLTRYAIDNAFDTVLLSGDLIDRGNRYFEVRDPLLQGFSELTKHGITTVAVAGNHDYDVLPRLCDSVANTNLHFLGRKGTWEAITLNEKDGTPSVRVVGWSFPTEHFMTCPLDLPQLTAKNSLPTIGLAHGDLDQAVSRYASLPLSRLKDTDYRLWILGHVHAPRCHDDGPGPPVLYPGSLQALDPGEPGCHGAWEFETTGPNAFQPKRVPLSAVRYETIDIPLDDLTHTDELAACVDSTIVSHAAALGDELNLLTLLSCRLNFTGRTTLHGKIESTWKALHDGFELSLGFDGKAYIDRAWFGMKPVQDLEQLKELRDPVGSVARLLLDLMQPEMSERSQRLIEQAEAKSTTVYRESAFSPVSGDGKPSDVSVRDVIIQQSYALLDALIMQKATVA